MLLPSSLTFAQSNELETIEVVSENNNILLPALDTSSSIFTRSLELNIRKADTFAESLASTPGLSIYGSTARNQGINIRGLGNSQFNDGMDSSTGIYLNGIYLARQLYGTLSLYDVESVLVLRGPQGSAYGLGNTAGEIHLITEQPSFKQSTQFSLSSGDFGYQRLDLSHTGTLQTDVAAGRLSFHRQKRDGLIQNVFNNKQVNDQDRWGLRGQLLLIPSRDTRVRLTAEYNLMDQNCCAVALLSPVSARIQASDEYMGYQRPGTNPYDRIVDNDVDSRTRLQRLSLASQVEWRSSPRSQWISLTGWNSLNYSPSVSDDGTSMRLLTANYTAQSYQFTQELRLQSKFRRVNTTVGAFFMHQNLQGAEKGVLGDEIARWSLGGVLRRQVPVLNQQNSGFLIDAILPPEAINGLTLLTPYSQTSNTGSVFLTGDWIAGTNTIVTTGLRWTMSHREAQISRSRSGGNLDASPLTLSNGLQQIGSLLGQDLSSLTYDGIIDSLVGANFNRTDARSDEGLSGKLALTRALGPNTHVYASAARGFKSGGINLAGLTRQVKPQFEPEIYDSLEIGVKHTGPDSRQFNNLSVYSAKVSNFQALAHDEGDGLVSNPRPNNVINIPNVSLSGLEFDGRIQASRIMGIGYGLAYNRAISTSFDNAPNEDSGLNDKNLSGSQLYNAPRWSAFTSFQIRQPITSNLHAYGLFDTRYRSGTFGAVDQSRSSFIRGYAISDFRVGLNHVREGWDLQFWLKNAFNKNYLAAVSNLYSVGDYAGYAGDLRTMGVSITMQLDKKEQ